MENAYYNIRSKWGNRYDVKERKNGIPEQYSKLAEAQSFIVFLRSQ